MIHRFQGFVQILLYHRAILANGLMSISFRLFTILVLLPVYHFNFNPSLKASPTRLLT